MLAIHTVAAGGGSVLHFDGSRYRVGPDSAGADPGPACYRNGGPLTLTDANVLLGRIQPGHFPRVFGEHSDQPLDAETTKAQFEDARPADHRGHRRPPRPRAGRGRVHRDRRGQHGQRDQEDLGAARLRHHPVRAQRVRRRRRPARLRGGRRPGHVQGADPPAGRRAVRLRHRAGRHRGHARAGGRGAAVRGPAGPSCPRPWTRWKPRPAPRWRGSRGRWVRAVRPDHRRPPGAPALRRHRHRGHRAGRPADRNDSRRSRPSTPGASPSSCATRRSSPRRSRSKSPALRKTWPQIPRPVRPQTLLARGGDPRNPPRTGRLSAPRSPCGSGCSPPGAWAEVDLLARKDLEPGRSTNGPAIIAEELATTVVEPGWQATVTEQGDLLLERITARPDHAEVTTKPDPVLLEIFNNLFMSVAEQMGVRLQATAHSVNIKERLDFSCALFDAEGGLIANAPHMPVHLGSMGESIKMVISRNPHIRRGDVYVLNDPYHGGTHLPDVTVVISRLRACGVTRRDLVLRGLARAPRRDRRHLARVHARGQHPDPAGRRADRQLAARPGRPAPRGGDHRSPRPPPPTRPATRPPTWPTCAPRSPPTGAASPSCTRWWTTSAWTWCGPTWATCSRTPPSRSAGSSPRCTTEASPTSWTTARRSPSRSA